MKLLTSLYIGFANIRRIIIDCAIKAPTNGTGTSTQPQRTFAGRAQITNTTGTAQNNASGDIYNSNVTNNSIILLQVERDANSASGTGNLYVADVEYDTANARRDITPGVKFTVTFQLRSGSLMAANSGITINYVIIN